MINCAIIGLGNIGLKKYELISKKKFLKFLVFVIQTRKYYRKFLMQKFLKI